MGRRCMVCSGLVAVVFSVVLLSCQTTQPASGAQASGTQASDASQKYSSQVMNIPTRQGVTESFELLTPRDPKAVVVSFTGGYGSVYWQYSKPTDKKGNFLERNRTLFAERGFVVASIAPPSDRKDLKGFRETPEHVQDIQALIAWLRQKFSLPLWLVGTSNGTMSIASAAIELTGSNAPDGIVFTSSILVTEPGEGMAVPDLAIDKIQIPVLVVHHESDGCAYCKPSELPRLMDKLTNSPRKELWTVSGGKNYGDPCQPQSYHGFNGIDKEVIEKIAGWIIPMAPASAS